MPRHHRDAHRALTAQQRRTRALDLRLQGQTFEEIAQAVGYQSRASAYKAVARALDDVTRPAAENFRTEQIERSYALIRSMWPAAQAGDAQAANAISRVMAALDKYMGIDKPDPYAGVDQVAGLIERMLDASDAQAGTARR